MSDNFDYNRIPKRFFERAEEDTWSDADIRSLPDVWGIFLEEYNDEILDRARELWEAQDEPED